MEFSADNQQTERRMRGRYSNGNKNVGNQERCRRNNFTSRRKTRLYGKLFFYGHFSRISTIARHCRLSSECLFDSQDVAAYCLEKLNNAPSPKDNAGYTPLHEACSRGHLGIAKLLLAYGANPSESANGGIR